MLKRILYCSKASGHWSANVPTDITKIIIQARNFNCANGVTGFLCFRQGYYMQLIEGASTIIDELYQRICADSRHSAIVTLLDENDAGQRCFSSWCLKLSSASQVNEDVATFIENKWSLLQKNGQAALEKLDIFYDRSTRHATHELKVFPALNTLENCQLKLESLPYMPSSQTLAHDLLDICAGLLGRWVPYEEAFSTLDIDEYELYGILRDLHSQQVLKVRALDISNRHQQQVPAVAARKNNQASHSFYRHVRNFFRRYA